MLDPEKDGGGARVFHTQELLDVDLLELFALAEPEPAPAAIAAARDLVALKDAAPPLLVRARARILVRGRVLLEAALLTGAETLPAVNLERLDRRAREQLFGAWRSLEAALASHRGAARVLSQLEAAAAREASAYVQDLRARSRDPMVRAALVPPITRRRRP